MVLSLKAALYGTVIATYTVASSIACIIFIHNNKDYIKKFAQNGDSDNDNDNGGTTRIKRNYENLACDCDCDQKNEIATKFQG